MCNYKLKENKMKRLIHTEESLILQKRIDLLKKKKVDLETDIIRLESSTQLAQESCKDEENRKLEAEVSMQHVRESLNIAQRELNQVNHRIHEMNRKEEELKQRLKSHSLALDGVQNEMNSSNKQVVEHTNMLGDLKRDVIQYQNSIGIIKQEISSLEEEKRFLNLIDNLSNLNQDDVKRLNVNCKEGFLNLDNNKIKGIY